MARKVWLWHLEGEVDRHVLTVLHFNVVEASLHQLEVEPSPGEEIDPVERGLLQLQHHLPPI